MNVKFEASVSVFRQPKAPAPIDGPKLPSDLPVASTTVAPDSCRRLTLLGTPDASKLVPLLSSAFGGADVRHVETPDIRGLYELVREVSADLDRAVLIHAGATDAAEVAARTDLADVEKGAESDRRADHLADLVEDLARRIPYLTVFVSMLCPRFDLGTAAAGGGGGGGMKLPNSVRRVMNVQLSMRLHSKKEEGKRILLVNNDDVLGCFEDEARRGRLFGGGGDGVALSKEGEKLLAEHWVQAIKGAGVQLEPAAENKNEEVEDLAKEVKERVTVTEEKVDEDSGAPKQQEEKEDQKEEEKSGGAAKNDNSPSEMTSSSSSQDEIREKENDEKMEKELHAGEKKEEEKAH